MATATERNLVAMTPVGGKADVVPGADSPSPVDDRRHVSSNLLLLHSLRWQRDFRLQVLTLFICSVSNTS